MIIIRTNELLFNYVVFLCNKSCASDIPDRL
jgi:hypothetical protein